MFYVIENPRMGSVRVITHEPRRDEIIVRKCETPREAFAELVAHEKELRRRRSWREAIGALLLVGMLIGAAALIPDLQPVAVEARR